MTSVQVPDEWGMEFDTVFVNGRAEGWFPDKRLIDWNEPEEERRIQFRADFIKL